MSGGRQWTLPTRLPGSPDLTLAQRPFDIARMLRGKRAPRCRAPLAYALLHEAACGDSGEQAVAGLASPNEHDEVAPPQRHVPCGPDHERHPPVRVSRPLR